MNQKALLVGMVAPVWCSMKLSAMSWGTGETRKPLSMYHEMLGSKRRGWEHYRRWKDTTAMATPSDQVMVAMAVYTAQYMESTG